MTHHQQSVTSTQDQPIQPEKVMDMLISSKPVHTHCSIGLIDYIFVHDWKFKVRKYFYVTIQRSPCDHAHLWESSPWRVYPSSPPPLSWWWTQGCHHCQRCCRCTDTACTAAACSSRSDLCGSQPGNSPQHAQLSHWWKPNKSQDTVLLWHHHMAIMYPLGNIFLYNMGPPYAIYMGNIWQNNVTVLLCLLQALDNWDSDGGNLIGEIWQRTVYRGQLLEDMLQTTINEGHVTEDIQWRTVDGGHVTEDNYWRT